MVYRSHNALYGLKQDPKAQYDKLDAFFWVSLAFQHCYAHNRLDVFSQDGLLCSIILYVDELLHIDLKTTFEMTDLGLLHYFLGMEVYQSHGGIFLSQHMHKLKATL